MSPITVVSGFVSYCTMNSLELGTCLSLASGLNSDSAGAGGDRK
jgi:hypothetical protein